MLVPKSFKPEPLSGKWINSSFWKLWQFKDGNFLKTFDEKIVFDVRSAVEWLKGEIANDKKFNDKEFFWINEFIDEAFADVMEKKE